MRTLMTLLIWSVGALAQAPFPPDAKPVKLAGDFKFTEGPTADAQGNVYFTDQPTNRILKWSVNGQLSTVLEPSGRSNGLCFLPGGALLACADEQNQLWKIDMKTFKHEVLVKDYQGKLLNGPNDVWAHPTGGAYFTDPLYKRPYWKRGEQEQDARGVYYWSEQNELKRVDGDYKQPNGIIGSHDGKKLYVADINARKTYVYDIQADKSLKNRRLFCEAGSDGMTIDNAGNVYLTSGKVLVFDPTGKKLAELAVPESPANVCFGGQDRKTLFITARTGLYAVPSLIGGSGPK